MSRLRSWALGSAVLALVATGTQPAHAGDNSQYAGGCVLAAATDENGVVTTPHDFAGALLGAVVLYSATPTDNPVSATLRCSVKVNGSEVASVESTGTVVVVAGPSQVAFHADHGDTVEVCTKVDFDDATPTATSCSPATRTHVPPQEVIDLVNQALRIIEDLKRQVLDPILCPIFRVLAPGLPPVVFITPEGDVYVLNHKVWDCPPYDTEESVLVLRPVEVIVGTDVRPQV
jgi:hypothetical protein